MENDTKLTFHERPYQVMERMKGHRRPEYFSAPVLENCNLSCEEYFRQLCEKFPGHDFFVVYYDEIRGQQ